GGRGSSTGAADRPWACLARPGRAARCPLWNASPCLLFWTRLRAYYATVVVRTLAWTRRRTSTTTASTTTVIIRAATAASSRRPFDHWLRKSVGSTVDFAP